MPDDDGAQQPSGDITTIPAPDNVPEPGEMPAHWGNINNLAGDAKLTSTLWQWLGAQYERFKTQGPRQEFVDSGGTMDTADKMYRVSLRKDETSAQHQDTLSNVTSTVFLRGITTVTASINTILFGDGDQLPAEFEPEINTDEYTQEDGTAMADQQNMLEQLTYDEDKRRDKIKEIVLFACKYANEMVLHEWDRRVAVEDERVPIRDDDGRITEYRVESKPRVIADWPTIRRCDMKDMFFDSQIDDMDAQRCILHRTQKPWEWLMQQQQAGFIMNMDKIRPEHLYVGEGDSDVLEDRHDNAGEDFTSQETGMYDVWNVKCRIPVREMPKRKGRGAWEPAKAQSMLYWATFVGKMGGEAVCVRLIKNPMGQNATGYKLIHTHRDDKGAFHFGFPTILPASYWQLCTNMNQAFDDVTIKHRAPLVLEGTVKARDLKAMWRQNSLIKLGIGSKLGRLETPNVNLQTVPLADRVEDDVQKTMGSDKPVTGEIAFARTSATQSKLNLDQALQPLDELADYIAQQLVVWSHELDAKAWRRFGDPDTVLHVTHNNVIHEIKPAELYGPIKVKVTAVTRFRNSVVERQALNNFIQNVMPLFVDVMGPDGKRALAWDVFNINKLPHPELYFPQGRDLEARRLAVEDGYRILMSGIWRDPEMGENHQVHLSVLEPMLVQYRLLPNDERDENNMRMLQELIALRKQMLAEWAQGAAAPGQVGPGEQPPAPDVGLPGQITGDAIEAQEGALAQA